MSRTLDSFLICFFAALLFIPFLGNVHLFDWDEINFAECSREMLITGDYGRVYINFEPFWEKPPFFFWLQALSMKVFGVNEFAARFPNAICGILTLWILYQIGVHLKNQLFGRLWALVYAGSLLPHFYFHSGIIDPWFNLFIFLGVYFFTRYYTLIKENQGVFHWKFALLSGLFIGLSMITKGPVGFMLFGISIGIFWMQKGFKWPFKVGEILLFLVGFVLISLLWYGYEIASNGPWFIVEFLKYNYRLFSTPDAGHKGFPGYHVVVLLIGCFPASLFFLEHWFSKKVNYENLEKYFSQAMIILFFVVLVVFSMVQSKIVHYSSLCYFPLTFIATQRAYFWFSSGTKLPGWLFFGMAFLGTLMALLPLLLPFVAQNTDFMKMLLSKDKFALGNLETEVHWSGFEWLVGLFMLIVFYLSIYFFIKTQHRKGLLLIFSGTGLSVIFILWAFIGRIEQFSQGTAISFFESKAQEDCYLLTFGYRSYAHYFYGKLKPENKPLFYYPDDKNRGSDETRNALLNGPVGKQVFVVVKITHKEEFENTYPHMKLIESKNGWVFYKRW